jgi:hypothetical protein
MHVIAKMRLTSIEDYGYSRQFKFSCVHDSGLNIGDNPENRAFTKATPNGEAKMMVDNQYVWPAFNLPGEGESESQHYVVFIDAKKHTLEDVRNALAQL